MLKFMTRKGSKGAFSLPNLSKVRTGTSGPVTIPAAPSYYYGVWEKTQGVTAEDSNPDAITVGCKFTVFTNGYIYGVRVYRVFGSEAITGALWLPGTSTLLASKVYNTAGANSTWVDILFDTPVAVSTGTNYTIGAFCNNHYAHTTNVNPHVIGEISVSSSVYDDTNSLTMPTTTFNAATDYMVSPLYSTAASGATEQDRSLLFTVPAAANGLAIDGTNTGAFAAHYVDVTGAFNTSCDNQIVEGYRIAGELVISHNNVTVRNCIVNSDSPNYGIHPDGTGTRRTGYDIRFNTVASTLSGGGSYGIGFHDGIAYRNKVTGFENFFSVSGDNAIVRENYCHLIGTNPAGHNDGIEMNGGSHLKFERNYIVNEANNTTAIMVTSQFGPTDDVLIDGNYLASNSNYTLQCTADVAYAFNAAGITITNNTIVAGVSGAANFSTGVAFGSGNTLLPHSSMPA
jgi:hypothetical protein